MKKSVEEIMQEFKTMCEEAGYKYLVQIDDGQHVFGMYSVTTDSDLHYMAKACNGIAGSYSEEVTT